MQVTIDIPESLYRQLNRLASVTHRSVEEALLEQATAYVRSSEPPALQAERKRAQPPFIPAGRPGTVDLNQNLNDAMFDDFDPS